MRKATALILLLLLLTLGAATTLAAALPETPPPLPPEKYRLGPGDVLDITVWGFEAFNRPVATTGGVGGYYIRPDGTFSFPLVGEVKAVDMTAGELTAYLTRSLSDFLVEPKITINIARLRTIRVYVLGEVRTPGVFNIERTHTLLDAVGAAGGPTADASKKNVYVVHRDQPDKPLRINLLKILQKGDMTQNISLGDGDAVYLTSNGRLVFSRDIAPIISSAFMISQFNR